MARAGGSRKFTVTRKFRFLGFSIANLGRGAILDAVQTESGRTETTQNMEDNMVTVMGATGHTGKKITEALLNGEKVHALARSQSKLAELKNAEAEALPGDTSDAAFLTKTF